MVGRKTQQIFIPSVVGLLLAFLISILFDIGLEKFYYPFDPDPEFNISFSVYLYALAFIPIFLIAVLFQFLIAFNIWKRYSENKNILNLSLVQLTIISCLGFGVLIGLLTWSNFISIQHLMLNMLRATQFAVTYWTPNFYILKLLEQKKQNGR